MARNRKMAGLFDKQAEIYVEARPTYPKEWYSKLAALTPQHSFAWDAGTGNGQAALGVSLLLLFFFFKFSLTIPSFNLYHYIHTQL